MGNNRTKHGKGASSGNKLTSTLVDILIAVYGRFDLLKQCLDAIPEAAQDIPYNIVLVDNASPDKEEAKKFYLSLPPSITVIRNQTNLGFPKANNQAARKKSSPLIFMLNSDCILHPNSLAQLISNVDDPTIGVAGMKLLFPDDCGSLNHRIRPSGRIQHVGMETDIHAQFAHIFIGWSADNPRPNRMRDTYAVTGAALLTRRKLWQKVGGLFEGYGQGTFEDVDYCMSVRQLGYNIVVDTKAVATHYVGGSSEPANINFPLQMNRLVFVQRWSSKITYSEFDRW